jgi:hypothetical protein
LYYQVSVQFDGRMLTSEASQYGEPLDRLHAVISTLQQVVGRPLDLDRVLTAPTLP